MVWKLQHRHKQGKKGEKAESAAGVNWMRVKLEDGDERGGRSMRWNEVQIVIMKEEK